MDGVGGFLVGIRFTTSRERKSLHSTQKALEIDGMVKRYANPGDTILEPVAGSGTTQLAAKLYSRRAIGIELSEEYCAIVTTPLKAVI